MDGPDLSGFKADVAVLTWPKAQDVVRLVGWTTPTALLARGQVQRWPGVGDRLYISPEDLFSMGDLKSLLSAG
jgi:hypothetical protein